VGLFGYFPTYTLGNIYAGCLYRAMTAALPGLAADLERGDTRAATGWLKQQVQQHGGLYEARELIERASGDKVSAKPLLEYLTGKFRAIYRL